MTSPFKAIHSFEPMRAYEDEGIYRHTFVRDVAQAVIPQFGNSTNHPTFNAIICGDPDNRSAARRILKGIASGDSYRTDDRRLICDAVQEICQQIAWLGKAVYEFRELPGEDKVTFNPLPGGPSIKLPKTFVQIIPINAIRRHRKLFVLIESTNIFEVALPRTFGTVDEYLAMLETLTRFSSLRVGYPAKECMPDLGSGPYKGFTFERFEHLKLKNIFSLTQRFGWVGGDSNQDHITEFYYIYRYVSFCYFQARLREHVTEHINNLFTRLNISVSIEISGIPSSSEILEMREKLINKEVSFTDAMNVSAY